MIRSRLLQFLIIVMALIGLFSYWYNSKYSMDVVSQEYFGMASAPIKLLIATQGSTYKDKLTRELIHEINSDNIYIDKCDITHLPHKVPEDYNAIILIHTWEISNPPREVSELLSKIDDSYKVFALSTSGSGDEKIDSVDGISGASIISETNVQVDNIVTWIDDSIDTNLNN